MNVANTRVCVCECIYIEGVCVCVSVICFCRAQFLINLFISTQKKAQRKRLFDACSSPRTTPLSSHASQPACLLPLLGRLGQLVNQLSPHFFVVLHTALAMNFA